MADCEYDHAPVDDQCFELFRVDDVPGSWKCTRPEGHDGPHVMCIPKGQHAAAVEEVAEA